MMTIIATTAAEVPVAYDVTLDSWVIDVRPTACTNDGGTVMLDDVSGSPGPSKAKGRTRAAEGRCQNGYGEGNYCAGLPVRHVLGSVKRSLRGRLACCAKAPGPARGHLQIRWWWTWRRRRRGITVGEEKKRKKQPSTSADWRCRLRASQTDRDEKLSDAISYCKTTMGFSTPGAV